MRRKPQVGDVFSVPIDAKRVGYGQIVAKYGDEAYYVTVFDRLHELSEVADTRRLVAEPIALLALTFDAKFAAGHWPVVGHEAVSPSVPLPAYQEMLAPNRVEVVDYSGARRRPATQQEASSLPYRTIVAPAMVERALRARHGLEAWQEEYAELQPDAARSSVNVFRPDA